MKPWEHLQVGDRDGLDSNWKSSWASVQASDLTFEVCRLEEDDVLCVCLGVREYQQWDQSMPDEVLERFLPEGAEVFELQESMFEVESLSSEEIREALLSAGMTEVNNLNPYR